MLPTVVLLHGANSSHAEMLPLIEVLRGSTNLLTPDLVGHGGRPLPERFSVPDMAADIVRMLDDKGIDQAFFVGYSFGGYLAMYLARHFPGRVRGICSVATRVTLDADAIGHWVHLLDPERMARSPGVSGKMRAEELAGTHHPQDWQKVVFANRAMFVALGAQPALSFADLRAVRVPALVISGAQDQLVPAAETQQIGDALNARTILFPGQAHPLLRIPVKWVGQIAGAWIAGVAAAQDCARGQDRGPAPALH